jgi:hypothetical protein
MLLAFIVRRAVCGLTTKNYNKLFLSVIAHLDAEGWSERGLGSFLLEQRSETGRFPRDEEFEQRWIAVPAYSALQPIRVRAVLEEIECAKRTRFHETATLASELSVEHILPRQWETTWPLADGTLPTPEQTWQAIFSSSEDETPIGRIIRRNRLKDTFGNLTLLTKPLNSSISNGPFATKRTALQEHSLLVLNREVTQHESWDEERIVGRSKALFAVAKVIWQMPQVAVLAQ